MTFPDHLLQIIRAGRLAVLPPDDITVSEWADRYRILPATANQPGRWSTETTPHLQEPMNAFSDPEVEEITIMGSAQIGKTSFLENCIGYTIHIDPAPILYMAPTVDVSRTFASEKFDPMVEDSPELRQRVLKKSTKDKDNTILLKRFPGGFIKFVGGNSPHGLRQMSIPIIFSDDIDSIEVGLVKEGDPVLRAEKRSQTFEGRKKKIRVSTPTRKDASRIEKFFKEGSRHRYYVNCLSCGHEQILTFEQISWEKDEDMFGKPLHHYPETARIACAHCGTLHTESERREMLKRGQWKAENPAQKRHLSFHINEISSTLSTLQNIVSEYIKIGDDSEKLEVFTNLVLGLPYSSKEVIDVNFEDLMNRAENFNTEENPGIPREVLLITAGVDVQKDRLEIQVLGWGRGEECWVLWYERIMGDTDAEDVWESLDVILNKEWLRADGLRMKIFTTGIDSGYQGTNKMVYEYCRTRKAQRVRPVKGNGLYKAKLFVTYKAHNKTVDVIHVGTNEAKAVLYEKRLMVTEPGPRYIHFNEQVCDIEYFSQLTAEHGVKKTSGMISYVVYEKKKHGLRNEALDTWIYAYVMMVMALPNWDAIEKNLMQRLQAQKPGEEKPEPTTPLKKAERITPLQRPAPVASFRPRGFVNSWR